MRVCEQAFQFEARACRLNLDERNSGCSATEFYCEGRDSSTHCFG